MELQFYVHLEKEKERRLSSVGGFVVCPCWNHVVLGKHTRWPGG